MNHEIVQLKESQVQEAIEVLGYAFKDDLVFRSFAFQEDQRRLRATKWFNKLMLHYTRPCDTVYTTLEGLKGVAIWIPPGQFPLNEFRLFLSGAYALPFNIRLSKLLQFFSLFLNLEELHKTSVPQPHWYLAILGVHPDHQSQGVGSSLIQPTLDEADRDNLPCYLETSTERAVRFYQRHRFEVVKMIDFSQERTQHIWAMKRESLHP
jgi:hypothetical protein